eukprot:s12686_g1.t1
MEYGRDAMAPVLQYLDGLLVAIGHGLFDPDRTRSGRWVGCRSLDDALRKVSDMARADGEDACVDGSGAFEGVWEPGDDWGLPESRVLAASDGSLGPGPEPERDSGDSEGCQALGDESSSCSLQDEEESDDAERMAELAGVRVADAMDGEDSAQVGSFFRHVVSGVLHRVRVLNPEFEGEATVFFCGDGEDSAQVGSFFRHVVSGVLHRVRVLNPEFEGEATVFFCGRQANANYKETKECSMYEPRKCAKCWSER